MNNSKSTNKLRVGTDVFKPRARLMSVLGDQLIRDVAIGVLELVKNGYDADAKNVTVNLINIKPVLFEGIDKDKRPDEFIKENLKRVQVLVEDDGEGMTLETILDKWLTPAIGHKEEQKEAKIRSKRGRLPLGEKGVGRFATHKIARTLELISRAKKTDGTLSEVEVVVNVNWDKFDNADKDLSEVEVSYKERVPEYFLHKSGTALIMSHGRNLWSESDVRKISHGLRRLMSPFKTPESFHVKLKCPDFPKYENLDAGEILNTAHAKIEVVVDDNGIAEYEYKFKLATYKTRKSNDTLDLRLRIDWDPPTRKSRCGAFLVTFYIWDRDHVNLALSKTDSNILNLYTGVSVFRDGIRVMPYGEPEDDWLEADKDRYMKSSDAISRKNIVGIVDINQTSNLNLRDKSNREGFIENEAFEDFYMLLRGVLKIASDEFVEDRAGIRSAQKERKKQLTPAVEQLQKSFEKIDTSINDLSKLVYGLAQQKQISESLRAEITIKLEDSKKSLENSTAEVSQASNETVEFFEEREKTLIALAGTGLAAEKFTHEFARLTREARIIIREVARSTEIRELTKISQKIKTLEATLDALNDMVTNLGPLFYIKRRTKEQEYDVKTLAEHALLLNRLSIEENKIKVKVEEPYGSMTVRIRRGTLIQVFNNLIDNSCYWLGRMSESKERNLAITVLSNESAVLISDNGPGVPPKDRMKIFDAFFSNKVDGRGLGLYIAREALADAEATIELVEEKSADRIFDQGTTFKIQFDTTRTGKG
jgi:signal transduction histidine kinase